MHNWYLRANYCDSRIIAAACATRATSSSGVSIGVSYTKHFISPQMKISIGVRSGERGGHCTGPSLPIQGLGKTFVPVVLLQNLFLCVLSLPPLLYLLPVALWFALLTSQLPIHLRSSRSVEDSVFDPARGKVCSAFLFTFFKVSCIFIHDLMYVK